MKNLFGNRTWAQYSIKTLLAKLYWNKAMFKQLWFLRDQETAVQKSDSSERLSILYMLPWEQVIHIWEWLNLLWNQEVTFSGNERTMQSAISHYLNSHPSGRIWFLFLLWPPPLTMILWVLSDRESLSRDPILWQSFLVAQLSTYPPPSLLARAWLCLGVHTPCMCAEFQVMNVH